MANRWETVVELPRWTAEMALATLHAGIEVTPDNGFTAAPTTAAMMVEAETADLARRRIRDALEGCGVHLGYAQFRGPAPLPELYR